MTAEEMLEWVTGWPWPVIIVLFVLIAGGIARIMYGDKKDLSEHQSSGPVPDKDCVCECR